MKKIYIIICMLYSVLAFTQNGAFNNEAKHVSLIEVLANKEQFNEERIRISGYYVDYGRYGRLFLNKEDALYNIFSNCLLINYDYFDNCTDPPEELFKLSGMYIAVDAMFNKYQSVLHNGFLYDIYSFSKLERNDLLESGKQ